MTLTPMPILTDQEMAAFESACFADWLNHVDAIASYASRREQPVSEWRELFDAGATPRDAVTTVLFGIA